MTTHAHTAARKALVAYFEQTHGLTLMPLELDEITRLALDLARASEDAAAVLSGQLSDRHRFDRMESAGISVCINTADGKRNGWIAHTERTGWWLARPTLLQTIDAAIEALKGAE